LLGRRLAPPLQPLHQPPLLPGQLLLLLQEQRTIQVPQAWEPYLELAEVSLSSSFLALPQQQELQHPRQLELWGLSIQVPQAWEPYLELAEVSPSSSWLVLPQQ
jgi:hypothetical protein